jgi:hypothetical protein
MKPLLSKYCHPDIVYGADGEPIPAVRLVGGVYAPDGGVALITDVNGRQGLIFPAYEEWTRGPDHPHPWPGWHRVDFDPSAALREFIALNDVEGARRFAAKYGPLWACAAHPYPCFWKGVDPDLDPRRCRWVPEEPLDWWLAAARMLRSVLVAADRLRNGQRLRPEDWNGMGWKVPEEPFPALEAEALFVASRINGALWDYGVYLGLGIRDGAHFEPELNAGLGFLPSLWQQIVATIAGGRLAVCSSCAWPYIRMGRAAKRGFRNFCPECSRSGARQLLSRRARQSSEQEAEHPTRPRRQRKESEP